MYVAAERAYVSRAEHVGVAKPRVGQREVHVGGEVMDGGRRFRERFERRTIQPEVSASYVADHDAESSHVREVEAELREGTEPSLDVAVERLLATPAPGVASRI